MDCLLPVIWRRFRFFTHTHTHIHCLVSSVVTSQPVTWQTRVRVLLAVQGFTDDQAVTVLLEQEDGVLDVKGHSLTHRSGSYEL